MSPSINHHTAALDDIDLHYARCAPLTPGNGAPPVIFCHGFPGLWYSWRHQLAAVAEAGHAAIAMDQRGYGRSGRPLDPVVYDSHHTVGDLIGLMDHLDIERAILVGHDFGAAQVYNTAVRHPERVAAVVGVACPYDFDLAGRGGAGSCPAPDAVYARSIARPDKRPTQCFADIAAQHFYHMHYFQTIGPPERELGTNPALFLRRLFWALSAGGDLLDWRRFSSEGHGYLDVLADPAIDLPWPWMSRADMDYFVAEFTRCRPGEEFTGGLNSYRVADRNWDIGLDHADCDIIPPSLFIAGADDPVLQMIGDDALAILKRRSRDLRGIELIADAGHFVQQEQAGSFNRALLSFLSTFSGIEE